MADEKGAKIMMKKEQDSNTIDVCERKSSRTEVMKAFKEMRMQAADIPEMSLEEINAEIHMTRVNRKNG